MSAEEVELSGKISRSLYRNEDNGFRIIHLEPEDGSKTVTVVGNLGALEDHEHIVVKGVWRDHPRYGRELVARSFQLSLPESAEGIRRVLASGLIAGVGHGLADRIVEHFGAQTREVLDGHPERLGEVKGLGKQRAQAVIDFWREREGLHDLMVHLAAHGIGMKLSAEIQRVYGSQALACVRENPYRMIREVRGMGFITADRLALGGGLDAGSPARLRAGLRHQLTQACSSGHCYLPREELIRWTCEVLRQSAERIEEVCTEMLRSGELSCDGDRILDPLMEKLEREVCAELHRRSLAPPAVPFNPLLLRQCLPENIELGEQQIGALRDVLQSGISALTGGPGVGKTTLIEILALYVERQGLQPVLAAPTGRAAQRIEEATGRTASTLHRLLGIQPADDPLVYIDPTQVARGSVFIVDECSMIDLRLMHALLHSVPRFAQIILVGDADQLPSVGPGRVFADILESRTLPCAKLDQVYRQQAGSLLVQNSHRLLRRESPLEAEPGEPADFYWVESTSPEQTLNLIERLALDRIPARFGAKAAHDLQVLSPMKRGPLGTENLNIFLQKCLNPGGQVLELGGGLLRAGDRVLQLANNYELDLFNGDVGRIEGESEEGVLVHYPGRPVVAYPGGELHDIALAYACTVHKAQGSEYPYVIMPVYPSHRHMLSLQLMYTALTRARQLCVWIGPRAFLRYLLEHPVHNPRHTLLSERLRSLAEHKKNGLPF